MNTSRTSPATVGVVEQQRREQQCEQHALARDRRERYEDPRNERQTDEIDVPREQCRIGVFDESQPPVVIFDIEPPRHTPVEVVNIPPFVAQQEEVQQVFECDQCDDTSAYGQGERPVRFESARLVQPFEPGVRVHALAVEDQQQYRNQQSQSCEVEQGPQEDRAGNQVAPAAESAGDDVQQD